MASSLRATGGPKLHLDSLQKLGFDKRTADQIRSEVQKKDGEAIDPFNYVPVSVLRQHAQQLGSPDQLAHLTLALKLEPAAPALTTKTDLTAYPSATTSASEPRVFAAAGGQLTAAELAPYQKQLSSLAASLVKQGKLAAPLDLSANVDAAALQAILQNHASALRHHPSSQEGLTTIQIETLGKTVASRLLPEHTERDAQLRLDSKHTLLGEQAGVKFFHQQGYEGFSIQRTGPSADRPGESGFVVHGFKTDRILVSLPPGHALLIIDSDGNERAAHLKPSTKNVLGNKESVVEIDRNMVEPFGQRDRIRAPSFTVKVLDSSGNAVASQRLAFGPAAPPISNELARGSFGYQRHDSASDEAGRWILDRGVPQGSSNTTPVGRRPSFSLKDGPEQCDRLLIQKDGQSFAVSDLLQLLSPPKRTAQAFAGRDRTYVLEPRNATSLDDPRESRLGGSLKTSLNDAISFDPALHATQQARWGIGGISVYGTDGALRARFDPLDSSQDKNLRPKR